MTRTIDARDVIVREELTVRGDEPNRQIMWANISVANEAADMARAGWHAIQAGPLTGKSVAWIGGGFCTGPRAFAVADCKQTVYELEPALVEFCPSGIEFIAGDWRDTLTGTYDLIIYDLGGDVPREELARFLAENGAIIPAEAATCPQP